MKYIISLFLLSVSLNCMYADEIQESAQQAIAAIPDDIEWYQDSLAAKSEIKAQFAKMLESLQEIKIIAKADKNSETFRQLQIKVHTLLEKATAHQQEVHELTPAQFKKRYFKRLAILVPVSLGLTFTNIFIGMTSNYLMDVKPEIFEEYREKLVLAYVISLLASAIPAGKAGYYMLETIPDAENIVKDMQENAEYFKQSLSALDNELIK